MNLNNVKRTIVINRINNIFNWMTTCPGALDFDPNASELVDVLIDANSAKLNGNPIDSETQANLDFIWHNRKENVLKNGLSMDDPFYKICESCYDGEISNIAINDSEKDLLVLMARIDLYTQQRRRTEPGYLHDNVDELMSVSSKINDITKNPDTPEVIHNLMSEFVYNLENAKQITSGK